MNEIIDITWTVPQKKYELLMLQELLKNETIRRVVEIGTWKGCTALLWAKMVSKYPDGIVYCCDLSFDYGLFYGREFGTNMTRPYPKQFYAESEHVARVKEFQGNSHDPAYIEYVKREVSLGSVDFMFIDGDHTYEGVKADFINFSSLVKPGGYIAFHDIRDTEHHRKIGCNVAQFWNELKTNNPSIRSWEFIDDNEYPGWVGDTIPSACMGIGVIRTPKQ